MSSGQMSKNALIQRRDVRRMLVCSSSASVVVSLDTGLEALMSYLMVS